MKIRHLRDVKRRPFATIVEDDNGCIGVALCNDNDRFNKKLGVTIATGRARYGTEPDYPNKKVVVAIPSHHEGFYELLVRQVKDHVVDAIEYMQNKNLVQS